MDRNGSEDETPLDSRRGRGNVRKKRISIPFFFRKQRVTPGLVLFPAPLPVSPDENPA